jgi:hypothetical protein
MGHTVERLIDNHKARNSVSHFSVLVIGDGVEKQLQPFHEFGCTGIDDEFVVDVDETEKMREEMAAATYSRLRLPNGDECSPYDGRFYRKPNAQEIAAGKSSWEDIKELPAGAVEFERPFKSLMEYALYHGYEEKQFLYPGQTPTEDHKYGRVEIDANGNVAKIICRTNPNHQWDWWVIGGRWSNMLLNKQGVKGDQFRKGDIDFAAMRTASAAESRAEYDKMEAVTKGIPLPTMTWSMAREKCSNIDTARSEYGAQPWVKAVDAAFHRMGCNVEYFRVLDGGRDAFVRNAEIQSFCTFAVVKDGKWYERGSMGWWGCVSDEKDTAEWQAEFAKLVEGLPDDTLLTVVDCHT